MKLIGYVAHNLTLGLSASRTARLKNVTDEVLRRLIGDNLRELYQIISWNIDQRLLYYRITSNLIPYVSAPNRRSTSRLKRRANPEGHTPIRSTCRPF